MGAFLPTRIDERRSHGTPDHRPPPTPPTPRVRRRRRRGAAGGGPRPPPRPPRAGARPPPARGGRRPGGGPPGRRGAAAAGGARLEVTGHDVLKTAPRGYPRDHPRIELLRHKGLIGWKQWPVGAWLGTRKAKDRIVDFLHAAVPLNDWLEAHVGPAMAEPA
jgi:hypothetical protein